MIQVNKDFLKNENYIKSVIEKAKKEMREKQRRYNRYTRSASRKDIDVAIEYYATTIATGYFAGVAPEITVKQETNQKKISILKKLFNKVVGKNADIKEFQILIDHIRETNDDSTIFYNLVKDYFITGSCYAIQFENKKNELRYANVKSVQTVGLYDYGTPVDDIGLIRIWVEQDEEGKDIEIIEIITDKEKIYYKGNKKQNKGYWLDETMTEEVNWKYSPTMCVENPDGLCIFSVVESLIDALETIISNNKETFEQNADAKLIAIGYAPENPRFIYDEEGNQIVNPDRIKEDDAVLNAKMLYVSGDKDSKGDFKWLLKELNDTASENHKKTLIEFIFMILCVPNLTDIGFTNADNSSALEKKFFSLEQLVIQAEKLFKKEYLELFENFVDRINTKYSTNFDASEIDITFKRNLPTNKKEIVDMWKSLRGIVSDETIIEKLPFDIDTETELAKIKEQDDENIMKFQTQTKVGDENVGGNPKETNKLPKGLQEKAKVND